MTRHRLHLGLAPALVTLLAPLAFVPQPAWSAGIERVVPSPRILFREGRYGELGMTWVTPDLSGSGANLTPLGAPLTFDGDTGNLLNNYWQFSGAFRDDITDRLSYAIVIDEPWGADTSYGRGSFPPGLFPPNFSYAGTTADLDSYQITAILAYDPTPQVKLYGGLRAQRTDADAAIPFVGPTAGLPGYTVSTDKNWGYGFLVGAAYHRPEIALRVALTYHSRIEHDFETTEFDGMTIPGIQDGTTRTDVETPQSVTLEFHTGVAPGTLVFGSVRWVDWSAFAIAPPTYVAVAGRPLVDYEKDWWTYTLGIGRQLAPDLTGAFSVLHEPSTDTVLTTLGPIDGRTSITGALTYAMGKVELTGGVTYGWLGSTENVLDTRYDDGNYAAIGMRVGYSF